MKQILTGSDLNSSLWLRVKEELEHEQAMLRSKLESPEMDHVKTSFVRGQLSTIKQLLNMEQPAPSFKPASSSELRRPAP